MGSRASTWFPLPSAPAPPRCRLNPGAKHHGEGLLLRSRRCGPELRREFPHLHGPEAAGGAAAVHTCRFWGKVLGLRAQLPGGGVEFGRAKERRRRWRR